jgi:hypothetical protein
MVIYTGTSGSSERSGTLERLTSLVPAFPVSPIVTQDRGLERVIPGICGPRHGMSFGWWDPSGSCLRTYQASFLEMMDGKATGSQFLESFPSWGLMLDGEFIAQPTPGHRTLENGGGSWPTPKASADHYGRPRPHDGGDLQAAALWPTPAASSGGTHTGISAETARNELARGNQIGLGAAAALWPTPRAGKTTDVYTGNMKSSQQSDGSMHSVSLPDYVKMWNTPNTMDALAPKSQEALDHEHESARPGRSNPGNLRDQIAVDEGTRFWATPTGEDAKNTAGPGREKRHGPMLNLQVTKWPTPATSQDYKPVRPLIPSEAGGTHGTMLVGAVGDVDPELIGGSLNPDWVEQHLMSLPEGWTRLEPVPDGAYDEWFGAMRDGTWWDTERGLPRVTTGAENRVNRLKMLGNGIVPATLALFLTDD